MTARQILRTGTTALLLLLVAATGCAAAQASSTPMLTGVTPALEIEAPTSPSDDTTPVLKGTAATAAGDSTSVVVTVTGGGSQYVEKAPVLAGAWLLAVPKLAEGAYSASVTQVDVGDVKVTSAPVSFTVDLTPPALTLRAPSGGSATSAPVSVGGQAGTAAGDLPAITVQVFAGSAIASGEVPVETIVVQAAAGGEWSATVAGLEPGTYTVRAEQSDLAGNIAVTASVSFDVEAPVTAQTPTPAAVAPASSVPTVASSAPAVAPSALFTWLPAQPHVDERVALLSTSTAGSSPLTEDAWATTTSGPFEFLGVAHSLTFTSAGEHLVRLKVTAADGQTSSISKELSILPRRASLMDPFPVVQFAGSYSSGGLDLKQLRVMVPLGTHVVVRCIGRRCPAAWEKYGAAAGHGSLTPVQFRMFERFLPAGVELTVTVFQAEEIGKMTRFYVRSGQPPLRIDTCVDPTGGKSVACGT